ncbi:hypothetical protein IWX90DRAFT_445995 [Phyllosticta citrichinensis]|uniref:PD-(D/E)XK nuclease-like domain-containing protein n=1 Tax=Phyllosticta citrichinensis TaxID=1130410 RepID=A0ABR1XFF6_9PEZI
MYSSPDRISDWIESILQPASPAKKRRLSPSPQPPPSRKRCRLPTPAMSQTPSKRPRMDEELDQDDTPRPSRPALSSKRTRTQSSHSSASSSARSPTKTLANLTLSAHIEPVNIMDILSNPAEALGDSLNSLFSALPSDLPCNLIPSHLKCKLEEEAPWYRMLRGVRDSLFYEDTRPMLNSEMELDSVENIVTFSHECNMQRESETSWNELVHREVLFTALRGCPAVGWRNVTRATISPRDLLSQFSGSGVQSLAQRSRIVDYAIYLKISASKRLEALLGTTDTESVNATAYEVVRLRPIAVSIETKKPDTADANKALTQLATWTSLQLKRFQQLTPGKELLRVPMILVLGFDWDLYFFVPTDDEYVHAKIYGPVSIGNTRTHLNTYRLVQSLRAVAKWTATKFDNWWTQALE